MTTRHGWSVLLIPLILPTLTASSACRSSPMAPTAEPPKTPLVAPARTVSEDRAPQAEDLAMLDCLSRWILHGSIPLGSLTWGQEPDDLPEETRRSRPACW